MTEEWDFGQVQGLRIIERPRLTRILDESEARILMLVAPAGFGKTTLARQWLSKRRHGWYRGSPASADVAALAVGLAEASHVLFPTAGERMRERLRATGTPEQDVEILAELLAEDLEEWPDDAWLEIDDYHFACESEASEKFVDLVCSLTPIRVLIASRVRPRWATARRLLYGEIHEVGRTLLAMDDDEAGAVLANHTDSKSAGVLALADGWPAAIGLAALTDAIELPEGVIPEALYRYFAEELYQAADPEIRSALCKLALVPSLSLELAGVLFPENATEVIEEGMRVGFLSAASRTSFDVHPLVRAFLNAKFDEQPESERSEVTRTLGQHFVDCGLWDEAFALLEYSFRPGVFFALLEPALPSMLESGRLLTLGRWIELGRAHAISHPVLGLAEAEITFRQGLLLKAEALSLQAARDFNAAAPAKFRAYYLAGISAHLRGAAQSGLDHHTQALRVARSGQELRDALWGQLLASMILEQGDGEDILDSLERIRDGTPEAEARLAHARLVIESQLGDVASALPNMELAMHLVPKVRDPVARAGFRTAYGQALVWMGFYRRAASALQENVSWVKDDRLEFALPHVLRAQVLADIGLGRLSRARLLIERIESAADQTGDPYLIGEVSILRTRLDIAQGLTDRTCALAQQDKEGFPTRGEYGEYLALLGLAFAGSKRWANAEELLAAAADVTRLKEVRVLSLCGHAIVGLASGRRDRSSVCDRAFRSVVSSGHVDAFVCAYRSGPELLPVLYRRKEWQNKIAQILINAEDRVLAKKLGLQPSLPPKTSRENLSPREREVFDLLGHGLTNKQMASSLYITESTVKVHLRHIFEKLGVSSRMEAAMKATAELED